MKKIADVAEIRKAAERDLRIKAGNIVFGRNTSAINRGECRMILMRAYLSALGIKAANIRQFISEFQAARHEEAARKDANMATIHLVRGPVLGEFLLRFGTSDAISEDGDACLLIDIAPVMECLDNIYA